MNATLKVLYQHIMTVIETLVMYVIYYHIQVNKYLFFCKNIVLTVIQCYYFYLLYHRTISLTQIG